MEALNVSCFPSFHSSLISARNPRNKFENPICHIPPILQKNWSSPRTRGWRADFKIFSSVSSALGVSSTEEILDFSAPGQEVETERQGEKFDWYAHWYPLMPICDLDKRRPHGKKVIGIDVVIWWDRNENAWKVFDDTCPHRLAPLSEGRIDQWGRLQCVYHGWCFSGSGDCSFIPQAPRDGPPIHTSKKACAATYPSCVQNGILWFWPNSDPQFKDISSEKKPHYIPELDDPSFTNTMIARDIPYGSCSICALWYHENCEDACKISYCTEFFNYLLEFDMANNEVLSCTLKADREGGRPLEISIEKLDINGFISNQLFGDNFFVPPCLFYGYFSPGGSPKTTSTSSTGNKDEPVSSVKPQRKALLIFYCIPVSPGNSRLIFASPRNFGVWIDKVIPRWIFHIGQNLILDSDLYLLHLEERKIRDVGSTNWHKSCYVPTKSDILVVSFRRWLNKYGGTQVDWRGKYTGLLPPTPAREQLFDRYWSHTVICSSCSLAHKSLNALKIALQIISFTTIAIFATTKQNMASVVARNTMVSVAVLCFLGSKWLSHFIYRTFRYHDYDHAFR
ncbi:protochlorophyllide-dependent translocon component 52, chloroplastic-like [Dorcoceras hygrometricum]|uniref:Protochlorophyllide-dependent translocon component 52, chloroplastic-like n=1 Tax=Dorcoceras hygrometricum TaxID=472368 RepID=A0A2Z7BUM4_9LAMI|nr:protochlorophyllide-dependent translocon component 52, chloroplastic-like [Dorcoceras hygrometricum]